jgi:hypothetical protein
MMEASKMTPESAVGTVAASEKSPATESPITGLTCEMFDYLLES